MTCSYQGVKKTRVVRPSHDGVRRSETKEEAWITYVGGHLSQEELEKGEVVTWSGFHSKLHEVAPVKPPAEIGILPLFPDKSTDPGILRHAMLIVQKKSRYSLKACWENWCYEKRCCPCDSVIFLSLQSRPDADILDFFRFENQREPPSLSDRGRLRSGTKSDILKCLGVPATACTAARDVTVIVIDMPAVVHMVRPARAATFTDYVPMHLVPFLKSQLTPIC